ncbi:hypothetical protein HRE53_19065 [Acaryochloris sp. 'Moss Beach']|uniref:hypothetical protein n=1 Tax=Acaryochloris sp. 'Moss Beach' TaxID=2740837 RepID=UPI001F48DBB7|nr:hypothetical protein [Acaryochloris sp. 'Moss Beach']UJB68591.1 hypothetical protein HRE53_19065 [Acaryochloris sp. 'Moss Beach']
MALIGVGACYIGFRGLQLTVFAPNYHPRRKGRMIAKGKACATHPNEVQTTPLSQMPCIAYEFFILEPRNSHKGSTSYAFLHQQSQGQWNLSVQTPRGQVQIKPSELDLDHIHFEDRQDLWNEFTETRSLSLLSEQEITLKHKLTGTRRTLILREKVIRNGDAIRVLGRQKHNNRLPLLEDAIVTDKPISRVILESSLALVAGVFALGLGINLINYAFR